MRVPPEDARNEIIGIAYRRAERAAAQEGASPFEVVGEGVFHDRRPQPEPKERQKPFRHTHIFQPVGLDAWDPKVHPGSQAIPPGTPVKRISQIGSGRLAFHWIEDREGNRMSVWKSSLQPRQPKPKPSGE